MVIVLLVSVLFLGLLPSIIWVGGISGRGGIKLVSANTPSANEPAKDFILVHTVQLKPMIAHFSGGSRHRESSEVR